MNQLRFVVGVDPGIGAGAVTITDRVTGKSTAFKVDFATYLPPVPPPKRKRVTTAKKKGKKKSPWTGEAIGNAVIDFIHDGHELYFSRTQQFLVEQQPPGKHGNKIVSEISKALYVGFGTAYPHAEVSWSSPKTMRTTFDMTIRAADFQGATVEDLYDLRKAESVRMFPHIIPKVEDQRRFREGFTLPISSKRMRFFVDPIDSSLHAAHYCQHPEKFPQRTRVKGKLETFPTVKNFFLEVTPHKS